MAKPKPEMPFGTHAGRALSDLITQTLLKTKGAALPAELEAKRRHLEQIMDDWEGGMGAFVTSLFEGIEDSDSVPPAFQKILERAGSPTNQIDFLINVIAAIGGAFGAIVQLGSIYWRADMQQFNAEHNTVPLSPADCADAVERNLMTPSDGFVEAIKSGISGYAFERMIWLSGEPPGLADMLRLWRRGQLDENTLDKMIAFSRVKTEWTDYVKELATEVLSGTDIVEAYIKNLIPKGEAEARWYEAGGRPQDFDLAQETAGEAIGIASAGRLFNHHLITQAEFDGIVAYSRVNPKWQRIAELQRHEYLSVFQITNALKAGTATAAQGTEWLLADGYPQDQVAALVAGAASGAAGKAKQVTEAMIIDTYEAGLLDKAKAVAQLEKIGYHADAAAVILEAYDARKILQVTAQGVTVIRKAVLSGHISKSVASAELDSLGIDSVMRDHYLALWAIEARDQVKDLTMAEIGSMFKKGIVSEAWAVKQWIRMGYSSANAQLLAYEYGAALPDGKAVV